MIEINSYSPISFVLDKEDNKGINNFDWFVGVLSSGEWEPATFESFKKHSNKDKIALDFGGWIGVTSIWLSHFFKKVYSFEPDGVAIPAFKNNIKRNSCDNVELLPFALYNELTNIGFENNMNVLGGSESQIKHFSDVRVETVTLDSLSKTIPFHEVGFVKVDIEGSEQYIIEDLFRYALKYKWTVYLEIHPQFIPQESHNRILELCGEYPNQMDLDRGVVLWF